jgi:hypothetical protein
MSAEKIKDTISFLEGYAAGASVLPGDGTSKCVSLAAGCLRDALVHIRNAELAAERQRKYSGGLGAYMQGSEDCEKECADVARNVKAIPSAEDALRAQRAHDEMRASGKYAKLSEG